MAQLGGNEIKHRDSSTQGTTSPLCASRDMTSQDVIQAGVEGDQDTAAEDYKGEGGACALKSLSKALDFLMMDTAQCSTRLLGGPLEIVADPSQGNAIIGVYGLGPCDRT